MSRHPTRRRFGGALAGAAVLLLGRGLLRPAAAEVAHVHRVTITAFRFDPPILLIRHGDIVEWTNTDIAPHTASAEDGAWDTGGLAQGATGSVRFDGPGEHAYVCVYHPHMRGMIRVLDHNPPIKPQG